MKNYLYLTLLLLAITIGCSTTEETGKGILFIVGGGKKPDSSVKQFIRLCGEEKILVISSASADPIESGRETAELFRKAGAANVDWLFIPGKEIANTDSVVQKIVECRGVFFTGGVQSRLMERVGGTRASEALLDLYQNRNGVIGGTSAGAAVMSQIMITGDGDFGKLVKGNIVNIDGFGFINDYIIDQHFVVRQRNNRLLSLVIEKGMPGIGIDESTAIIFDSYDTFTVYGKGHVLVYDPRGAVRKHDESSLLAMDGIKLSVLKDGDVFDMKVGASLE